MPTCKNDCKRYYRGDEPSPKGLGYCAHAEKINQRRKGRDGKFWVVKVIKLKTGKRIRRWTRVKKAMTKKRKAMTRTVSGGGLAALHARNTHRKYTSKQPNQSNQQKTPTLWWGGTIKKIAKLYIKALREDLTPHKHKKLSNLSEKYRVLEFQEIDNSTSRKNQEKVKTEVEKITGQSFDGDYESIDYQQLKQQGK